MQSSDRALERLAAVLLERLRDEFDAPDLTYGQPPTVLEGGKFSSVYVFELTQPLEGGTDAYVIRLIESAEQVRLEAGLHHAAITEGLRAPRLLLWEAPSADLGAGYLVMERLSHRAYLRGVEPWQFALDVPKLMAAWPRQLSRVMGALARVDTDAAIGALEAHGVPEHLARPGRHLRAVSASLANEPALAAAIDWLHENRPSPPERWALVHGDLWPGNVFVDRGETRLIDWTRGGIDDPALDLGFAKIGFALMPEPFPPPPPIRQLVRAMGSSIAQRLSIHCEPFVGGAERVRYYEALRCAVELADVVTERSAGSHAGWEHGVPALVGHLEHITSQSIDFT